MEYLASLFVGKPLSILSIAAMFVALHIALRHSRFRSDRHPRSLLFVAAAWMVYAVWEWLIIFLTPDANIRVDLMITWPILLITSIWFSLRAFKLTARGAGDKPGNKNICEPPYSPGLLIVAIVFL